MNTSMNKMMTNLLLRLLGLFWLSLAPALASTTDSGKGIGQVAQNLLEPVGFMSDMVQTGCFVIGLSFIFAAIIKYFEHKRSPLMVPISTVVFLAIAGLVLIGLPFLSLFLNTAVPYSLLKRK